MPRIVVAGYTVGVRLILTRRETGFFEVGERERDSIEWMHIVSLCSVDNGNSVDKVENGRGDDGILSMRAWMRWRTQ